MSDWDDLVEPARGALEALLRKGDEMADRITELEAKLAKAVEFTGSVVRYAGNCGDDYLAEQARAALAELKGQTNDQN